MPAAIDRQTSIAPQPVSAPDDGFLVAGVRGGDAAALRKLMARYDRLIRYTIFRCARSRCRRDPDFLETVAADTWAGFVRAMKRDPTKQPDSVKAYLVRIARNQSISALRRATNNMLSLDNGDEQSAIALESPSEPPEDSVDRAESLEILRECVSQLTPDNQRVATQLAAITDRRWKQAGETLGMSESTLRSRWTKILGLLRDCVTGKGRNSLAPWGVRRDP